MTEFIELCDHQRYDEGVRSATRADGAREVMSPPRASDSRRVGYLSSFLAAIDAVGLAVMVTST